jgi:hypothetical protein
MKIRLSLLRRKPQVVYVLCPNCQQQTVGQTGPIKPKPTPVYSPSGPSHQVVAEVAERAVDAAADVDAFRRQTATGDPIRDQMLTDIQTGFTRNVTDIGRRLSRPGDRGGER